LLCAAGTRRWTNWPIAGSDFCVVFVSGYVTQPVALLSLVPWGMISFQSLSYSVMIS
jgi:hypothetical protein